MLLPVLRAMAVCLVVTAALAGWGQAWKPDGTAGSPPAADATAVRQLTSGAARIDVPSGFAGRRGFTPGTEISDGRLRAARLDGGCSSVFGGTRWDFTPACRSHDLGYDLLRDAADQGAALPASARRAVDAHFGHQLRSHCRASARGLGALGCQLTATVYIGVVDVNSWRQGWGVPITEHPSRFAIAGLSGLLAGGLVLLGGGSRWRRPSLGQRVRPAALATDGEPA